MTTELQNINKDTGDIVTNAESFSTMLAFGEQMLRTGFLPKTITTPAQVVAIILTGKELGLPPMTSFRHLFVINGRVGMSAEIQLGLFQKAGGKIEWIETTNDVATLKLTNQRGESHTETYTIDDAKRAQLLGKDVWKYHPKRMLRARAASGALTAINPGGNLYDPDELEEIVESVNDIPPKQQAPKADPPKVEAKTEPKKKSLLERIKDMNLDELETSESQWVVFDKSAMGDSAVEKINTAYSERKLFLLNEQAKTEPIEEAEFIPAPQGKVGSFLDEDEPEPIPNSIPLWVDAVHKCIKPEEIDKLKQSWDNAETGRYTPAKKKEVLDAFAARTAIVKGAI